MSEDKAAAMESVTNRKLIRLSAMANCSGCLDKSVENAATIQFVVYAIEGVLLALSNFLIFACIVRQPLIRIRKQYIVLAGLGLINAWHGMAGVVGGTGRVILIAQGRANELRTSWECWLSPWIMMWQYSDPLTTLMLMIVSIDRIISVADPLFYYGLTWKYALGLVTSAYGYTAGSWLVGAYMTSKHTVRKYPALCMISYATDPSYYGFMVQSRVFFVAMSIALYLIVLALYRRANTKVAGHVSNSQLEIEKKKQKQITVSFGISSAITFFFCLLPIVAELMAVAFKIPKTYHSVVSAVRHNLTYTDSLLDFYIFTTKQKDFKMAMKALFKCETLTQAKLNELDTVKPSRTHKSSMNVAKKEDKKMEVESC